MASLGWKGLKDKHCKKFEFNTSNIFLFQDVPWKFSKALHFILICQVVVQHIKVQKPLVTSDNYLVIDMDMYLTFRGPCIVMYSYNKSQQDAQFLKFS
jgi:hypothetical protein